MAESASAQLTEPWVPPSLQLPELARVSRPRAEDDLSDAIVRFRGISLRALENIRDRLLSGEAAAGVELLVAKDKLAEGVDAGHTLHRTGANSAVPAYCEGELTFRADQVRAKPRKEWTTDDVCTHFVLPLAQPTRCFCLDLLAPEDVGKPFEGAFVSHCWQYSFADLVDTLLANTTGPLEKSFVWVDNFCANQPLLSSKDVTEEMRGLLHSGLHKAIARFDGGMLVVFDSWSNPKPITRAWCMWEVYGAALSGNNLQLVFAGSEAASVEQWLSTYDVNSKTSFLRVLADMDPRAMQCHDQSDLDMIRGAVEVMDGGFSRLKQMVTERLTRWLLRAVEDCVKSAARGAHDEAFSLVLHSAAMVVSAAGHLDVALGYYTKALAIKKETLGERHSSVANTLNNMANVYRAQGMLGLALETYEEALDIKKETLGPRHSSMADTLNNMADVFRAQGKLDLALATYEEALDIKKETLGPRHSSVADTLYNMALLLERQRKMSDALRCAQGALEIYHVVYGASHAETVDCVAFVARLSAAKI